MVIENLHTILADRAMTSSSWSEYQACFAKSPLILSILVSDIRHYINLKLLSLLLQEGLSRDDSRVSKPSKQEEHKRQKDAECSAYWQSRGYLLPKETCQKYIVGDHDCKRTDIVTEIGDPVTGRAGYAFSSTAETISARPQFV